MTPQHFVIFSLTLVTKVYSDQQDLVSAPSSHWANVYTSDQTHYSEPVRDAVYPLPAGVSRSDWFNSYPYHKFEDDTTTTEAPAGIIENVANAVGSVRKSLTDFGDGVVNSALGLVGANKKQDSYEERDGKPDPIVDFALDLSFGLPNIGYVYNGFHLRGPQSQSQIHQQYQQYQQQYHQNKVAANRDTTEELAVDGNTVRPTFTKADVSPVKTCSFTLTFEIMKYFLIRLKSSVLEFEVILIPLWTL